MKTPTVTNPTTTVNNPQPPLKLHVSSPENFNSTVEIMYIASSELEGKICEMFSGMFKNLSSVAIEMNDGSDKYIPADVPVGEFVVNMYFKPTVVSPNASIENIINLNGSTKKDDKSDSADKPKDDAVKNAKSAELAAKIFNVSGVAGNTKTKAYAINGQTKSVLSDFMFQKERTNWGLHVYEVQDPSNWRDPNNHEYYIQVCGISLGMIVDRLYGSEDPANNDIYDYQISFARNITLNQNRYLPERLIAISRMSRRAAQKITRMTSAQPMNGYFGTNV